MDDVNKCPECNSENVVFIQITWSDETVQCEHWGCENCMHEWQEMGPKWEN